MREEMIKIINVLIESVKPDENIFKFDTRIKIGSIVENEVGETGLVLIKEGIFSYILFWDKNGWGKEPKIDLTSRLILKEE